jgi:hypothetical protein
MSAPLEALFIRGDANDVVSTLIAAAFAGGIRDTGREIRSRANEIALDTCSDNAGHGSVSGTRDEPLGSENHRRGKRGSSLDPHRPCDWRQPRHRLRGLPATCRTRLRGRGTAGQPKMRVPSTPLRTLRRRRGAVVRPDRAPGYESGVRSSNLFGYATHHFLIRMAPRRAGGRWSSKNRDNAVSSTPCRNNAAPTVLGIPCAIEKETHDVR